MNQALNKLERVVESMRDPIGGFAATLQQLEGDNALSLVLFGRILTRDFDRETETARSVLVVRTVDLAALARLAEQGVKFGRESIAAPLIMTPEYIRDSLDTFPVELLDIKRRHLIVFGEEHFESLTFDNADIRRQCERELKTVLIGLRQGLLAAAGRTKLLSALEVDAARGLMRVLRAVLWLKDEKEWHDTDGTLSAIEKMAQRALTGVRAALDRNGQHGWNELKSLYRDVEKLAAMVDTLS